MTVVFYVGLHQPSDAQHFDRACISVRRLWGRSKPIDCPDVLVDSGAFTELHLYGGYRSHVSEYASEIRRLHDAGVVNISAAVAQDYMCEPFMLAKTGLSIAEHQRLTIERYEMLIAEALPVPAMAVLQGYAPADYASHARQYGDLLPFGAWVGVGSVCKRNGDPEQIVEVLAAVRAERPDLRLHGFGVKQTALLHPGVRAQLDTADSMAWSYSARKQGRNGNSWTEAKAFADRVQASASKAAAEWQMPLPLFRTVAA
ncbi:MULTISPECIES: hypothetical protein [unclassified Mesorhizobium]|uniref:deazapurine DNA modification protein DpdA family protein n=1 Tax=unclassified Mesorhizobium TaxID=325217 RepID=UPI000FCB96AE|nr:MULTISPECIES: hypothetical protein [unclassified Mesorhizobium]RUV23458.1 hypothetical protein EOA91_13510 [Mesorhizobium sp. M1A.F.Ca.IN.022.04.1.1]RWG29753.1 MAG: hypothetical protein EOQ60_20465 [Mesorhizobium sp.]TIS16747.1 MAG: hypothetical protein E5X10_06430 [Mesorhizobium sp.]